MPDIPSDVLVNAYEALDRATKSPDMPADVQFACAVSAGQLSAYLPDPDQKGPLDWLTGPNGIIAKVSGRSS